MKYPIYPQLKKALYIFYLFPCLFYAQAPYPLIEDPWLGRLDYSAKWIKEQKIVSLKKCELEKSGETIKKKGCRTFEFNKAGYIEKETSDNGEGKLYAKTRYLYFRNKTGKPDSVKTITVYEGLPADAPVKLTYHYNKQGKVIYKQSGMASESYSYYPSGLLKEYTGETPETKVTSEREYNAAGQITFEKSTSSQKYRLPYFEHDRDGTFYRDSVGTLRSARNLYYDDKGRLIKQVENRPDGHTLTIERSYLNDTISQERTTSSRFNDITILDFMYDEKGVLIEKRRNWEQPAAKQKTVFHYNEKKQKIKEILYEGPELKEVSQTTWIYHANGKIKEVKSFFKNGDNTKLFDQKGNLLWEIVKGNSVNFYLETKYTYTYYN